MVDEKISRILSKMLWHKPAIFRFLQQLIMVCIVWENMPHVTITLKKLKKIITGVIWLATNYIVPDKSKATSIKSNTVVICYVCDLCLYAQRSHCTYIHLSRPQVCCICVIYFICNLFHRHNLFISPFWDLWIRLIACVNVYCLSHGPK